MAILGRAEQYAHYATEADVFDLAALYLEGIAHDHPFRDGNKPTAWVVCVKLHPGRDRDAIALEPRKERVSA